MNNLKKGQVDMIMYNGTIENYVEWNNHNINVWNIKSQNPL
jgi:hypothetical protein